MIESEKDNFDLQYPVGCVYITIDKALAPQPISGRGKKAVWEEFKGNYVVMTTTSSYTSGKYGGE